MAVTKKFTLAQIAKHNSLKSCWVIHNGKIYDVTEFAPDHPGGDDLILDHAGKNVTDIMKDELQHSHSDAAYEMLEEYYIGDVVDATCQGTERGEIRIEETEHFFEDDFKPKQTDLSADAKRSQFLDLRKPLFPQMVRANFSKEFYLQQVHQPRYVPYSAPLFGNFLDAFTKTAWYMIPTIWLPVVGYQVFKSLQSESPYVTAVFFFVGIFIWTLVEYILHRFLFHLDDLLPDHPLALLLHFTLHGIHHYLPMDKLRLVMPPALGFALAYPLMCLAHILFPAVAAYAIVGGAVFGYIGYDCTHYYLHHAKVLDFHFKEMKKYHLAHHYKNYESGYGITSKIWDYVFGTQLNY
ncbi:fatty acid alpha-hydroxylase [Umbelopsis nana]